MLRFINSKIILGLIIIIAISIVGIKIATKEERNIKGVKYEKEVKYENGVKYEYGKIVETDLGKYNKNKNYEGYEAYILSDNSEYNIFKNNKIEVKYPKSFEIEYITNELISFSNKSNIFMDIEYFHTNRDIKVNDIIKRNKKYMKADKKGIEFNNVKFKAEENKVFEIGIEGNSEYGGFSETILNGKNNYELTIIHMRKEIKEWDEIIKNIKESFKVL